MKTFLLANLYLAPFLTFTVLTSFGFPFAGSAIGLAVGLIWAVYRYGARLPAAFLSGQIIGLALVLFLLLADVALSDHLALAIVFAFITIGAAVSVMTGKPWTADFSSREYSAVAELPAFLRINNVISSMWVVIYGWFAIANWAQLAELFTWTPLVVGAALSIQGPKWLIRRELRSVVAGDRRNDWAAPNFASSSSPDDNTCDVAVIGSGIGGLTAAALLADQGLKVRVFEHHVVAGGFAHNWLRKAKDPKTDERLVFRFDSGVHDVSGAHPGGPVDAVFQRLGLAKHIAWRPMDQRYVIGGRTIDVPLDWRAYVDTLCRHFPDDEQGIRDLFDIMHAVYTAMYSQAASRGGIPGGPKTPEAAMAFAENHSLARKWMDRPWSELLNEHVSDPNLEDVLSILAHYISDDPNAVPVSAMAPIFGYYFKGGVYPVGGSGHIAECLVKAIEARGGVVHLRSRVTKVVVENGEVAGLLVTDTKGKTRSVKAKAVVSNVDVKKLFTELVDDPAIAQIVADQVGESTPACSAIGVHLGLRGTLDLPPVVHGETTAGSIYMVSPSSVDPTAAPDGYSTIELLDIVHHDEAAPWFAKEKPDDRDCRQVRRSTDYEQKKLEQTERLVAAAKTLIPDLDSRIVFRADASPITFYRYAWTTDGAIYGTRFSKDNMPTRTSLPGLVVAGAMTHGAGIEAVVISGAEAADALVPGTL